MSPARSTTPADWQQAADLLACPACTGALAVGPETVHCDGCGADYPVHEGIPQFARLGSAETWGEGGDGDTSRSYQDNYQEIERARRYNEKYDTQLLKRASTRREHRLLRKLLARVAPCKRLLDLPCGGGRLSGQIAPATDLLIEADIALGQVAYGRESSRADTSQLWMTASAFHIPIRDGGVDGAVCIRLSHHLPLAEERERLLGELLRVSKRFVLMSFFDHHSPKNLLRLFRRKLLGSRKSPKKTMTVSRVAELARQGGATLVACPHLAFLGSGHRYALLVKDPA